MVSIRVKVTVPKEKFADKGWVDEVVSTMRRTTGPELKKEFQGTTETWDKKPTFLVKLETGNARISTEVYTTDDTYGLVNAGSPPHTIAPRRKGFLRYQVGFKSKTRAGSKRSVAGGKFGAWGTVPHPVKHPGFEARKFDQLIADDYLPTFQKDMQEAFKRAARS